MSSAHPCKPRRLLGLCVLASAGISAQADVIHVRPGAGPPNDGVSWATAFVHLQDALAAVQPTDEIWIAVGTYKPDQGTGQTPGDIYATFAIPAGTTLIGGFAGDEVSPDEREPNAGETVLSGDLGGDDDPNYVNRDDNCLHVVSIGHVDLGIWLERLTISGGNARLISDDADREGGGIHAASPTMSTAPITLVDCSFRDNLAQRIGAGLSSQRQHVLLNGCEFDTNRANRAGALRLAPGEATLHASNCTFRNNRSLDRQGGAVRVQLGAPEQEVFENCVFDENQSAMEGGAVFGDGTFINCEFRNNAAPRGGAAGGGSVFVGCLFEGNTAGSNGGALSGVRQDCTDCVFRNNQAKRGGAVHGGGTFVDCIFEGNTSKGGGAINTWSSENHAPLWIEGCRFTGNVAAGGLSPLGGAISTSASATLIASVFEGNVAESAGAVMLYGGSVAYTPEYYIVNCAFWRNVAAAQAGALRGGGTNELFMYNTLVVANHAESGGIVSVNGSLFNCTIVANTTESGATLRNECPLYVSNSILWGNSNTNGILQGSQLGGVNRIVHSIVQGWNGNLGGIGNSGVDPLFVAPAGADGVIGTQDDDWRLSPGSPAIDGGWNAPLPSDVLDLDADGDTQEVLPIDLDGNARIVDDPNAPDGACGFAAPVDIGAYEFGSAGMASATPCPGETSGDGIIDLDDLTLLLVGFHAQPDDPHWNCRLDLNADLRINLDDLTLLLANYGVDCN